MSNSAILSRIAPIWIRLMAPFIPFTCEALWRKIGQEDPVAFSSWPVSDDTAIDPETELAEELLIRTVEDVESIKKLIQIEPAAIRLFIAPAWKRDIFRIVAESKERTTVVKEIMKDEEMRRRGKATTEAARQITTLIHRLPPQIAAAVAATSPDEAAVFTAAREFLENEFGVPVTVTMAEESDHPKARSALPFKPAIVIE
jgi:leucyl-tRNA synthetase